MRSNQNLTSAEEVLLAAAKINNSGKKEFTEWELTVEAWSPNKNRWGLRGYEADYPDHKRVMNEVMAGGTQKVVGKGWLERVKPNYYKVTSAGLAKAQSLIKIETDSKKKNLYEYDALVPFIDNSVFEKFCKDHREPKTWLGAAAFLKLKKYDAESLDRRIKGIVSSIEEARKWMDNNKSEVLCRDNRSRPITKNILNLLEEFLSTIEERFMDQFKAIRRQ